MVKLMVRVRSIMPTVTCTKDNFTMIKQTAMESTPIKAIKSMKGGGNQISNMAREKRLCQTAQNLRAGFYMVKRTAMVKTFGVITRPIRAIGKTMTSMVKVPIVGQIRELIVVAGNLISFMDMVFILGQTVEAMSANT